MRYFTNDWFSGNIPKWNIWLAHLKDKPGVKMLEIGSYQGRSALWALENILTHPTSHIYCCDPFEETESVPSSFNMWEIFQHNTRDLADKITVLRGRSRDQLKLDNFAVKHAEYFDVIYIDGDHSSASVLEDAILAWPLLKRGGVLIFDDFYWGEISSTDSCHLGINFFLSAYERAIRVVAKGYQVCVQKTYKNT